MLRTCRRVISERGSLSAAAASGEEAVAERLVELQLALVDQHPDERRGDALGRRPRPRPRRPVDARRVALVNDLALVHDQQAQRHLLGRLPVERPVGGRLQGRRIDVGRQRLLRDLVAVRPRNPGRVARRVRQLQDRQAVDVVQRLVGRENHAADALAERRAHPGRAVPVADDHRLARGVDLVVAALGRPDRLGQERQLLREDLLDRPVRGEQAVAHEDGLLPLADHLPLLLPVVVGFLLLRAGAAPEQQRARERSDQDVSHRSLHQASPRQPKRPPDPLALPVPHPCVRQDHSTS